jgi:hypothetical protein
MRALRQVLTDAHGRFPCRRTWEQRLAGTPGTLAGKIGCRGRQKVRVPQPWGTCGRAAAVWLPLAADLTPTNAADNEQAPGLIRELAVELRFLLGDQHYQDQSMESLCAQRTCVLVTTRAGKWHPCSHTDPGVEVRRLLDKTSS